MNAWNIDADAISLIEKDISRFVVMNNEIEEYLNIGARDQKYFIVAPKGFGKTLLLKAKSFKYRSTSGFRCIPKTLCEKMVSRNIPFSASDLNTYKEKGIWEDIWTLCLHLFIIKNLGGIEIPAPLAKKIGDADSLTDILFLILNDRKNFYKYKPYIFSHLSPALRKIKHQAAVFIDSVDEAFDEHIGEVLEYHSIYDKANLSHWVWINAQLGLVKAVRGICIPNKHIKIFVSLRSEAYKMDRAATALQNKSYTTELKYDKDELISIFIKNIENMNKGNLMKPGSENELVKFLGINNINHKYSIDSFGNNGSENILDFILRHTFRRPRELVYLGDKLSQLELNKRTEKNIIELINRESNELLKQYKRETIPYFRNDIYELFCMKANSNVLFKDRAVEINSQVKKEKGFDNVIESLYKMGILGWVERNNYDGNNLTQYFLPAAQHYLSSDEKIPQNAEYFVTHPSTDLDLYKNHGSGFYERRNIIGHGCPFYESALYEKFPHIHFGLSRASVSLILPYLKERTRLAIIQKPNNDWTDLEAAKKVELFINGVSSFDAEIYNDLLDSDEKDELIDKWMSDKANVIFYTEDASIIRQIVSLSKSISTSKGNGGFNNFGNFLEEVDKINRVNIYTFEYNHREHKQLKKIIGEYSGASNIRAIPVISERYYYGIDATIENDKLELRISCEEYGEVVAYAKNEEVKNVFRANKIIKNVDSSNLFRFYLKKHKFLIDEVYRFCKLYENRGKGEFECDFNSIFQLFGDVQIQRLQYVFKETNVLRQAFQDTIGTEIHLELLSIVIHSENRYQKLPERYRTIGNIGEYYEKIRKKEIFPSKEELGFYLEKMENVNPAHIKCLKNLLYYIPNDKTEELNETDLINDPIEEVEITEAKKRLLEKLAEGDLNAIVEELKSLFPNNPEVILQVGRISSLTRDIDMGVVEFREIKIEENRIRRDLLSIIQRIFSENKEI